jgi:hypothetical protein
VIAVPEMNNLQLGLTEKTDSKRKRWKMLFIKDVRAVEITKIKRWAINFRIGSKNYLLHESTEDYETGLDLFEKINDKVGNYKLIHVSSCYGYMVNTANIKKGETYNSINKYKFAMELLTRNLISTNDQAIKLLFEQNKKIKEVNKLISELGWKSQFYI